VNVERFRDLLVDERKRVADAIAYLQVEHATSQDDENPETGIADTASVTIDRELDFSLEGNANNVLREIDAALGRIENGSFGTCSRCKRPIAQERLEAMPYVTLCIECKRQEERS
jgi:DnaK suppressor protein